MGVEASGAAGAILPFHDVVVCVCVRCVHVEAGPWDVCMCVPAAAQPRAKVACLLACLLCLCVLLCCWRRSCCGGRDLISGQHDGIRIRYNT